MGDKDQDRSEPCRNASACGAIGGFDRSRAFALASAFDVDLAPFLDREGVIAFADRAPRTWSAGGGRGWSWGRAVPPTGAAISWQDAAKRGDCGLVVSDEGSRVHSETSGAQPVYWLADAGAVYWSTRLDPLVMSSPGRFAVDWESWATMLIMGVGRVPRTPFVGIRRLPPHSSVGLREGRVHESVEEWPWITIDPTLSIEEGADEALAALGGLIARLPDTPAPIGLSGGYDARILAALAAQRGIPLTGITVNAGSGNDREERAAAEVASRLGIQHETVIGDPATYWAEAWQRGIRVDFQRLVNPWLSPAHERIGAVAGGPVLDGLGGQVIVDGRAQAPGAKPDPAPRRLAGALWRGSRYERAEPLSGKFGAFCRRAVKAHLRDVASFLDGHPNRWTLASHYTRTMPGVSHVAYGSLGSLALVEAPYMSWEVATRVLRIDLAEKRRSSLRKALLAKIDPRLAAIPTNHLRTEVVNVIPRRRLSDPVLAGYREVLSNGPLAPYIDAQTWATVGRGTAPPTVKPRYLVRTVQGVVTYHLWLRRYGDRVVGSDPGEALGLSPP